MMPAKLVKGAVPVCADTAAELPNFGDQLLVRHRVEVLVHDLSNPGGQAYEPLSVTDAPLFPCLTEYTLGEIETFLGLGEILLETEDGSLKSLEPLRHLSRYGGGAMSQDVGDFDRRERDDRDNRYQWSQVHVAPFTTQ
jgi:hypothetical protein